MSQTLFVIEVLGTIVSLPLMFFSVQGVVKSNHSSNEPALENKSHSKKFVYLVSFLVLVGIGIIIFATKSAMGN